MTAIAGELDQLRLAVGEVDAIAAVTLKWFDDEDWSGADPALVERAGFMLGVIGSKAVDQDVRQACSLLLVEGALLCLDDLVGDDARLVGRATASFEVSASFLEQTKHAWEFG